MFALTATTTIREGSLTSLGVAVRDRDNLIKTPKPKYGWLRRRATESTPLLTINAKVEYNKDSEHESDSEGDYKIDGKGHRENENERQH